MKVQLERDANSSYTPCTPGTIMSYAKDSHAKKESQRITDFNHFVIFDPRVCEWL